MSLARKGVLACFVAVTTASGVHPAQAVDVELRDRELALELTYPWRVSAMLAWTIDAVPLTFGASVSPEAEGGGLSLGVRPVLLDTGAYRLVWASWAGPIVYGRDGASGGVEAVTELQSHLGDGLLRFSIVPRVDVAAAWGEQESWRVRPSLVLAVGVSDPAIAVWLEGDLGYSFGGYGAGAFRLAGVLVVSLRPELARVGCRSSNGCGDIEAQGEVAESTDTSRSVSERR